jgi:predicted ATPase
LKTSVEHGLIFFNFEDAKWDWDEEKILKLEVSENIVEYIIQNTLRGSLRQDTAEILKFAACLGTRNFNTFVLSKVLGLPPSEVTFFSLSFN